VSDGAVSFYLDHFVRSRIAKVTYGVRMRKNYDSSDPEHLKRSSAVYAEADGTLTVGEGFNTILLKVCCDSQNKTYSSNDNERTDFQNTKISETREFEKPYYKTRATSDKCDKLSVSLYCYRGTDINPKWTDVDAGQSLSFNYQEL